MSVATVVHMRSVTREDVFANMDTSENMMNVSKQVSLSMVVECTKILNWLNKLALCLTSAFQLDETPEYDSKET